MSTKLPFWLSLCWMQGMPRKLGNATFWSLSPPSLASKMVSLLPFLFPIIYSLPNIQSESGHASHLLDMLQCLCDAKGIKSDLLTTGIQGRSSLTAYHASQFSHL